MTIGVEASNQDRASARRALMLSPNCEADMMFKSSDYRITRYLFLATENRVHDGPQVGTGGVRNYRLPREIRPKSQPKTVILRWKKLYFEIKTVILHLLNLHSKSEKRSRSILVLVRFSWRKARSALIGVTATFI